MREIISIVKFLLFSTFFTFKNYLQTVIYKQTFGQTNLWAPLYHQSSLT